MDNNILAYAVLAGFNAATFLLMRKLLTSADISSALQEKSMVAPTADGGKPPESSSRIAGLLGAVVISTAFWAIANAVIYFAFVDIARIKTLIDAIGGFLWQGAALFLPYAANQVKAMFPTK